MVSLLMIADERGQARFIRCHDAFTPRRRRVHPDGVPLHVEERGHYREPDTRSGSLARQGELDLTWLFPLSRRSDSSAEALALSPPRAVS